MNDPISRQWKHKRALLFGFFFISIFLLLMPSSSIVLALGDDPVDQQSDVDSSTDVGTHSNFEDMKTYNSIYDTLTEFTIPAGGFQVYNYTGEFPNTNYTLALGRAVNLTNSFIYFQYNTNASGAPMYRMVNCYFLNATHIYMERKDATADRFVFYTIYIIECFNEEFTVRKRGEIHLEDALEEQYDYDTWSGADNVSQCIVLRTSESNAVAAAYMPDATNYVRIINSTHIYASRYYDGRYIYYDQWIRYTVIEWNSNYKVWNGTIDYFGIQHTELISGAGNPDDPVVNSSRAIIFANWLHIDRIEAHQKRYWFNMTAGDMTNQVIFDHYDTNNNYLGTWFVVEFPASQAPTIEHQTYYWNPPATPPKYYNSTMNAVDLDSTFIVFTMSVSGATMQYGMDYGRPEILNATNWRERMAMTTGLDRDQHYTNVSIIQLPYVPTNNYRLDLEVQFINTEFNRTIERLVIATGTFDTTEELQVWEWYVNESAWYLVDTLEASTWNNFTIDYLTSSTYTIKFNGTVETGDLEESAWDIDYIAIFTDVPPPPVVGGDMRLWVTKIFYEPIIPGRVYPLLGIVICAGCGIVARLFEREPDTRVGYYIRQYSIAFYVLMIAVCVMAIILSFLNTFNIPARISAYLGGSREIALPTLPTVQLPENIQGLETPIFTGFNYSVFGLLFLSGFGLFSQVYSQEPVTQSGRVTRRGLIYVFAGLTAFAFITAFGLTARLLEFFSRQFEITLPKASDLTLPVWITRLERPFLPGFDYPIWGIILFSFIGLSSQYRFREPRHEGRRTARKFLIYAFVIMLSICVIQIFNLPEFLYERLQRLQSIRTAVPYSVVVFWQMLNRPALPLPGFTYPTLGLVVFAVVGLISQYVAPKPRSEKGRRIQRWFRIIFIVVLMYSFLIVMDVPTFLQNTLKELYGNR